MWRVPHQRYVGYLLAVYGHKKLQTYLENNRLVSPTGGYRTYLITKYPPLVANTDLYNEKHDLHLMISRHPDTVRAREILSSRERVYVEQCLLSGLDVASTSSVVAQKASIDVPESAIEMYAHYFWDVAFLTTDEWEEYLTQYGEMFESPLDSGYWAALSGSESLANYYGIPFELKAADAFTDLFNFAYANIMRLRRRLDLSPKEIRAVESLTKIMVQAEAARTKEEATLVRVLKALEKFQLKGKEEGFRELDEIQKEFSS